MKKEIDIHSYDIKLESGLCKVRTSGISKQNKELIEKFVNFCFANGIGKPSILTI